MIDPDKPRRARLKVVKRTPRVTTRRDRVVAFTLWLIVASIGVAALLAAGWMTS